MKVLMISTDSRIPTLGSKEHARMQSYASVTEELHIIVFTKRDEGHKDSSSANLFIYPTNSWSRWWYGWDAHNIAKRLRKNSINLVTAQDPFETGLIALKIARMLKAMIQIQLHTDFLSPYYAVESAKNRARVRIANIIFPRANCIRVVSRRLAEGLKSRYGLSYDPLILPIHLDIPVSALSSRRDFLRKKYPQFAKIIVMVSRLETEKNVFMALKAFTNIQKKYPGVGLVVVGDGSVRAQMEKVVEVAEANDKIVFEGWQNNQIPYLLSADIFINASNYEGYGRTLMEAAAAACPIVTTDVGIVGEVFNETNALISPPGEPVSFENNLEYALKNPEEVKQKAERAREAATHYMSFTESDRLAILKRSWESCGA